jgi:hypothetical protein
MNNTRSEILIKFRNLQILLNEYKKTNSRLFSKEKISKKQYSLLLNKNELLRNAINDGYRNNKLENEKILNDQYNLFFNQKKNKEFVLLKINDKEVFVREDMNVLMNDFNMNNNVHTDNVDYKLSGGNRGTSAPVGGRYPRDVSPPKNEKNSKKIQNNSPINYNKLNNEQNNNRVSDDFDYNDNDTVSNDMDILIAPMTNDNDDTESNNDESHYNVNNNSQNNNKKNIMNFSKRMSITDSFDINEYEIYNENNNQNHQTSMNIGFEDSFIDDTSLNIISDNMSDHHIVDDIGSVERFILNYNKNNNDNDDQNYNDNNNDSIENSIKYDATFDIDYDNDDLLILNSIDNPSIEIGTKNSIKNVEKNRIIPIKNTYQRTQSAGVCRIEDFVNQEQKKVNRNLSAGLHRKGSMGLGGTGVPRDDSPGRGGVNNRYQDKNGDNMQYNLNSLYNSPYQYHQSHNYAQHYNNINNENLLRNKNDGEKNDINVDEFEGMRINPPPPVGNMGTLRPKSAMNNNEEIPSRPASGFPNLRPQSVYPERPQSGSGYGTKFVFLKNIPSKADTNLIKSKKPPLLPVSMNATKFQKKNNLNQ